MMISILTYKLPKPWTIDEASTVFKSTAPKYLGMLGLIRKHYCLTEAGDRVRVHASLGRQPEAGHRKHLTGATRLPTIM
jgi:hypothetical protein